MGDGVRLNASAFRKVIEEDLEWLRKQPRSLEREHIELVLCVAAETYQPDFEPRRYPLTSAEVDRELKPRDPRYWR